MISRIFILSILALVTCSPGVKQASASDDPSTSIPWLCELADGRYCDSCPGCPQEDSGALCCDADECTEWKGGFCPGILGWCNNYTTTTDPNTGKVIAECHDG